jgi:FtsZ-interacting cell division protein ZipA
VSNGASDKADSNKKLAIALCLTLGIMTLLIVGYWVRHKFKKKKKEKLKKEKALIEKRLSKVELPENNTIMHTITMMLSEQRHAELEARPSIINHFDDKNTNNNDSNTESNQIDKIDSTPTQISSFRILSILIIVWSIV